MPIRVVDKVAKGARALARFKLNLPMNLKTADQKPRMTRIETTSIESVLQICLHPVGEGDARRKQFIIRVIRGLNCFFQDER